MSRDEGWTLGPKSGNFHFLSMPQFLSQKAILSLFLSFRRQVLSRIGWEGVTHRGWTAADILSVSLVAEKLKIMTLSPASLRLPREGRRKESWHFASRRILMKDKHIPRCHEVEVTWMLSDFLASKKSISFMSVLKKQTLSPSSIPEIAREASVITAKAFKIITSRIQ